MDIAHSLILSFDLWLIAMLLAYVAPPARITHMERWKALYQHIAIAGAVFFACMLLFIVRY